jgi:hypothetical protein
MRNLTPAAAIAAALVSTAALADAPRVVGVQATDLNGRAVAAPVAAGRTLLLLGFRHGDQEVLDGWRAGLGLTDEDPTWLEVAYIGAPALARGMIQSSMRKRFASPEARGHMAPVFGAPEASLKALAAGPGPVVLVLDRSGAVLAEARGAYSPANARAVAAAR